jgi:hypothetical protein
VLPLPVAPLTRAPEETIETKIEKAMTHLWAVVRRNVLRSFVERFAYDTAILIAEGDWGRGSLIYQDPWGAFFRNAREAAIGSFFDTLGRENGFVKLNLCDPSSIRATFNIVLSVGKELQPKRPRCTYSQLQKNWQEVQKNPDKFLKQFQAAFDSNQNDLGIAFSLRSSAIKQISDEITAKEKEREEGEGFKAKKSPVGGNIETPSQLVKETAGQPAREAAKAETESTGDIFADALGIFTKTLISRWTTRTIEGLFKQEPSGGGPSGGFDFFGGQTARSAAVGRDQFATLNRPNLISTASLDPLSDLSICVGDDDPDRDHCALDSKFADAVRDQVTVREAVEGKDGSNRYNLGSYIVGYLSSAAADNPTQPEVSGNLPYHSLLLLRKYRVIPVTWELAATYSLNYGKPGLTLKELIDAYDDASSPYYHMVDPEWVLTIPAFQCAKQGFVTDVQDQSCSSTDQDRSDFSEGVVDQTCTLEDGVTVPISGRSYHDFNGDGVCDASTDQRTICQRKQECVDEQSCIAKDENGKCLEYGYCTAEASIWAFDGDQCQNIFSTCNAYQNTRTNDQASFLKNTLSFGDCALSAAQGCKQYCSERSDDGNFSCTYDLHLGLQDSLGSRDQVFFLNDTAQQTTCDESDAGCSEFIRTVAGSNIVANSSLDQFSGTKDDALEDQFGFCSEASTTPGTACVQDSDCGPTATCDGWTQRGLGLQTLAVTGGSGGTAVRLSPSNGESFRQIIETGTPLAYRTFTSTVEASTDDPSCLLVASLREKGNPSPTSILNSPLPAGSVQTFTFTFDAFPSTMTATAVELDLFSNPTCAIDIESVKLEESSASTGVSGYGEAKDTVDLTDERRSCDVEFVGCREYESPDGAENVPGIVRNHPDFTCSPEFVGCKAYREEPTTSFFHELYFDPATLRVADRTGLYCFDNQSKSCFDNADCPGSFCAPSISLIPRSGQQCNAQYEGCEEFTNLDIVQKGGEGREYYTKIRPCIRPDVNQCGTFFAYYNRGEQGIQLATYLLQKDASGGPHLNDQPAGWTNDCTEQQFLSGEDPNCRQLIDAAGSRYYVTFDHTVTCSNQCVPLRNTLDQQIYNAVPTEGVSCPATANNCRQYKGNTGNNVRELFEDLFRTDVQGWQFGTFSTDTLLPGADGSIAHQGGRIETDPLNADRLDGKTGLVAGRSYTVDFWATGGNVGDTLEISFNQTPTGKTYFTYRSNQTYLPKIQPPAANWQKFTVGPVVVDWEPTDNETLLIESMISTTRLDNIRLVESDDRFLIRGSATLCRGNENCTKYQDLENSEEFTLKSFYRLCPVDQLKCEAVIDTHNRTSFSAQTFDYKRTSKLVPAHKITTLINDEEVACESSAKGCSLLGEPNLTASNQLDATEPFKESTIIVDPDLYDQTLCDESEVSCDIYESEDGPSYFKDPGPSTCTYRENVAVEGGSVTGWFHAGTNLPCPTDSSRGWAVPIGEVCTQYCEKAAGYSGDYLDTGLPCSADDQCGTGGACTGGSAIGVGHTCSTNADCGDGNICDYVVGQCSAANNKCTEFIDPNDQDGEASYFFINNDRIKKFEANDYDPKAGNVAFVDTSQSQQLDLNSNFFCQGTGGVNPADGISLTESLPAGQGGFRCVAGTADCTSLNPDLICEPLDTPSQPNACASCSIAASCGTSGLPCCAGVPVCQGGSFNGQQCASNADCGAGGTCGPFAGACSENNSLCTSDSECAARSAGVCRPFCTGNAVIGVRRDRTCDQYLACTQEQLVTTTSGQSQTICLERRLCEEWTPNGCGRYVDDGGILANETVANQIFGGNLTPIGTRTANLDRIGNRTTYNTVGLDWGAGKEIIGLFPVSSMPIQAQITAEVEIPNGEFSLTKNGDFGSPPAQWSSGNSCTLLRSFRDIQGGNQNSNYYLELKAGSMDGTCYPHAGVDLPMSGFTQDFDSAIVSFDAYTNSETVDLGREGLIVTLRAFGPDPDGAGPKNSRYANLSNIRERIGTSWGPHAVQIQEVCSGTEAACDFTHPSIERYELSFFLSSAAQEGHRIYLDNVKLKPSLAIRETATAALETYGQSFVDDANKQEQSSSTSCTNRYNCIDIDETNDGDWNVALGPRDANGNSTLALSLGERNAGAHCGPFQSCGQFYITIDMGSNAIVDNPGPCPDVNVRDEGCDVWVVENGAAPGDAYEVWVSDSTNLNTFKCIGGARGDREGYFDIASTGFSGIRYVHVRDLGCVTPNEIITTCGGSGNVIDFTGAICDTGKSGSLGGADIDAVVSLRSVTDFDFVGPNCRAYPDIDALSCTFQDAKTGELHVGWTGYCLERHPSNPEWCLNWYPVDQIPGAPNVFGQDNAALTRSPLYYCEETRQATFTYSTPRWVCLSHESGPNGGPDRCNVLAEVEKPKAKAYSLTADNWQLGRGARAGFDAEPHCKDEDDEVSDEFVFGDAGCISTVDLLECPIHHQWDNSDSNNNNGADVVLTDWSGDCDWDNYSSCVDDVKAYWDKVTVYQFNDDSKGLFHCGDVGDAWHNSDGPVNGDDCDDAAGGECFFDSTQQHDNASYPAGEVLPQQCTRLVNVVDSFGQGMPYAARIQGGLSDAEHPIGLAYGSACSPYGASSNIQRIQQIGTCGGAANCQFDPVTGNCAGDPLCVFTPTPVNLYHPYNLVNNKVGSACSTTDRSGGFYACGNGAGAGTWWVCDGGTYAGLSCVTDAECPGGTCQQLIAQCNENYNDAVLGRLNQLFAQSFNTYYWDNAASLWKSEQGGRGTWSRPQPRLHVCAGGARTIGQFCGIAPRIANMELNDIASGPAATIRLDGGNSVAKFTFDPEEDSEQKPIQDIAIAWDDDDVVFGLQGTNHSRVYGCSVDFDAGGKKICGSCPGGGTLVTDPSDPDYGSCVYTNFPKIQLEDNWKWCSNKDNDGVCYDENVLNKWVEYQGRIIVKP